MASERATGLAAVSVGRKARGLTIALAIDAVATPLLLAGMVASGIVPVPAPVVVMLGLSLTLLGPGLAAIAITLRSYSAVVRDLTQRGDSEPQQAMIRLAISGVALIYLAALAYWGIGRDAILSLLAIDATGIFTGWLLFIHLMVEPGPSLARRAAAMVNDVGLISVFLHFGGAYAAPWFLMYLLIGLGFGFRFGIGALVACASLSIVGFAVIYATTPYWRQEPAAAVGVGLALVLVPSYAASLVRRLTAAKAVAEEAAAAKSRFLTVLSHELRMPLNGILGMGALLARTRLDQEQRDIAANIQHSARALLGLIDDVLDLAKIEAGKLSAQIESFVLHELLGSAIAVIRPQARAKGLTLTLRIDPRLPHAYRGMPLQLRQVLINLLDNAVKFSPKGHIALTGTMVTQNDRKVQLALAVRDEGIGIPAEAQERIFDVFALGDESLARRFGGGSGLGLPIAKQLTEMMGGTMTVESEVGKGSTFTVTLALESDSTDGLRPPDLQNRQLIVISSDAEFASVLEGRIARWHGAAQWISDGEQALGELALAGKSEQPAVLVIDGRDNPLAALSLAHRATTAMVTPPITVFVAPRDGSSAIAGLAAAELAAVIEAPVNEADLMTTLLGVLAGDEGETALAQEETRAEPAAIAPSQTVARSAATLRPLKILVADDNASTAKVLKTVLESAGHEVETASDGEVALTALERARFDLALLDINMPEVNGYEVAKLYRVSHVGERRLPLVALTADATSETERLCREAGMDAVLTKPIEPAQLLTALDDIYARLTRPERLAVGAPPVVTPITAHPRFVPDAGTIVDETTFEALGNLGGHDFVREVVETFRKDGARLIERLKQAADKGDLREFRDLMHSLRSGAANVGGVKLGQTLTSLRDISTKDLRANGASYVEKITAEFARLEQVLAQLIDTTRRG